MSLFFVGEPEHLGGFGIAVDLVVEGVDDELLKAAHEVYHQLTCQY